MVSLPRVRCIISCKMRHFVSDASFHVRCVISCKACSPCRRVDPFLEAVHFHPLVKMELKGGA